MGYPDSFDSDESSATVKISNACNQTLYAARITWHKRDKDSSEYTISEA